MNGISLFFVFSFIFLCVLGDLPYTAEDAVHVLSGAGLKAALTAQPPSLNVVVFHSPSDTPERLETLSKAISGAAAALRGLVTFSAMYISPDGESNFLIFNF